MKASHGFERLWINRPSSSNGSSEDNGLKSQAAATNALSIHLHYQQKASQGLDYCSSGDGWCSIFPLPSPVGHLTGGISLFSLDVNFHCNSLLRNITSNSDVSAFAIAVTRQPKLLPYFSSVTELLLYLHYLQLEEKDDSQIQWDVYSLGRRMDHLHSYNNPVMYPGMFMFFPLLWIFISSLRTKSIKKEW